MSQYKGQTKTFPHVWKCPKCGQQNINVRRKTTIGKKSSCFCSECRRATIIEVKNDAKP